MHLSHHASCAAAAIAFDGADVGINRFTEGT